MKALMIIVSLLLPATAEAGCRRESRRTFHRQLRLTKAANNSYPVRDVAVAYAPTFKIIRFLFGAL